MNKQFSDFVDKFSLINGEDIVLACVSGGVDSMVLLYLLEGLVGKERLRVAHCNFMLRPGECDAETAMVVRHSEAMGVEYRVKYFDTHKICDESGESVQMAARRIRYGWFDEMASEFGCTKIAIAHHSGDTIETFFINLMRGTGLRGLTGIDRSREQIIRPLLFASRDEIERYAIAEGIEYMTDSSNLSTDYLRSRLRYDILPRFDSSSSDFKAMMGSNIERLSAAQRFVDSQVESLKGELIVDGRLDMVRLREHSEWEFILYEILRGYGFSGNIVRDISRAEHTGKRFYSEQFEALLDRDFLVISERERRGFEERDIYEDDPCLEWIDPVKLETLKTPSNIALVSADRLKFPLRVRKWAHGDYFMPLGMPSHKKVSDFLIDNKVSLLDKETQGVLLSGDDIVWLIDRRIDNRYRVTESTLRALKISF